MRRAARSSSAWLVKLTAIALSRVLVRRAAVLIDVVGTAATLGAADRPSPTSSCRLIVLAKRQLLWRVRRKLILSLRLHRLRAGAADRHLLPALRLAAVLQRQLVPGRQRGSATRRRSGAVPRAVHGDGDRASPVGRRGRGPSSHRQQALLAERNPEASLAIVPVGRTCDLPASRGADGPAPAVAHDHRGAVVARRAAGGHPRLDDVRRLRRACWPTRSTRQPLGGARPAIAPISAIWSCARGALPDAPRRRLRRRRRPAGQRCDARSELQRETGVELRGVTSRRASADGAHARPAARAAQLGGDEDAEPRSSRACVVFSELRRLGDRRREPASTLSIGMSIGELYDRICGRTQASSSGTPRPGAAARAVRDRRAVPDHRGRRARSWAWRWRDRSPARSTSCSSAPSACGRATSRTGSRSSATISSASWPSRSTR